MRIQQSESKYLWYAMDNEDKIVQVFHTQDECIQYVSSKTKKIGYKVTKVG
jgi:hypothetical protein